MENQKTGLKSFPKNFWDSNCDGVPGEGAHTMGVMSVLSVFLILGIDEGGLGFSKEQAGSILGNHSSTTLLSSNNFGSYSRTIRLQKSSLFCIFLHDIRLLIYRNVQQLYACSFLAGNYGFGSWFFLSLLFQVLLPEQLISPIQLWDSVYSTGPSNLGAFLSSSYFNPLPEKLFIQFYIFYMAAINGLIMMLINIFHI